MDSVLLVIGCSLSVGSWFVSLSDHHRGRRIVVGVDQREVGGLKIVDQHVMRSCSPAHQLEIVSGALRTTWCDASGRTWRLRVVIRPCHVADQISPSCQSQLSCAPQSSQTGLAPHVEQLGRAAFLDGIVVVETVDFGFPARSVVLMEVEWDDHQGAASTEYFEQRISVLIQCLS